MKRMITSLILILTISALYAQGIQGSWTGKLTTSQGELRVNFHINATDNGFSSTMDSPDQNAYDFPVDSTFFMGSELTIKIPSLDVVYKGTLTEDDEVKGTLHQMGQSLELNLTRMEEE